MKKYFKIGTALAFLFAVNFAPTLTTNVYATESTDNTNIVETPLATEQYNATDVFYDDSNVEVEEPLEIREPAHVESTAEANNVQPARAPTEADEDDNQWDTDKSKDASDLNENGETEITISLPSGEVQNTAEVVFVLDKSTYSDYPSTIENSLNLLNDLKKSGASVKVAIVHFNRIGHPSEWFDVQTQYDEIVAALKVKYSGGSNMHAGLLAAQELLESDSEIPNDNKFVVLISDGSVYLHCKDGDYTTPYTRSYAPVGSASGTAYGGFWAESYWNPYVQAGIDAGNVRRPKVPDADKWEEYLADVEARNNESNGDQYDYIWMYYDATTPEGRSEGYIETPRQPRTASNIDIAYWHCNETWKLLQGKYHTYAIGVNDTGAGEGNWDSSKAFMRYLNNNQEPSFDQLKKDLILLSKGSKVIDYVGNDFDFVNDKERIVVKIGDQVLAAEEISANNYGFGKNEDGTYKYTVEYVPGEEEHLVWNINEDVNNYTHTQLVFFEKLNNVVYEEGTHTVPTNKQGILYPINSEGIAGEPEEFEIPTVDYHIGKVIIHYEDLDNNVLRDNDELTGLVGENYETESTKATRHQEILDRGYKYWRSTGKVEGKFLDGRPINVTYLYEKLGQMIVKYLDADDNTNVLAAEEVKYGTVGDEYYTIDAKPENYVLSSISGEPYGKYTEDSKENPIVVIYYYTKPTTNVITHYVDADDHSHELTDADTKPGKVGEAYTTTARTDIANYTLVGNSGNVEGTFDKEDINVYYYYKRDEGTVTAYYIDSTTREVITEKTTSGYVPETYETAPINDIEGYRYINIVVGEETGQYVKDENIKVYYYYEPVGKVTVKYLEEGTNNVLLEEEVLFDSIGSEYTTYDYYKENINNYNWVRTEGNERGRYTKDDQVVIYYYKIPAVTGELVVNYIDQDNNLLDSWTDTQEVGTEYTTEAKEIAGYTPKFVLGNPSGTYSTGTTTVTYVYAKNPEVVYGTLKVNYIDTNNNLLDSWTDTQEVGTEYITEQKSFAGYTPKFVLGNPSGTYSTGTTTVTYVYEKIPETLTGEVVVKYIENTGRKLVDEDIVITGDYGTTYTTEQKSFDGYNFVAVYGPTQGTINQPKTTVIYMYEKVKSDETETGSCNNNCGCNCCSSCNNTCNNSCNNGEQEPTQPVINIDITINNDNSTEVNNENNNQDENNVNNENNPVNNADVNVETGDNVNNNSNNSESNAEGGNATNGDTNVNVETGDNNTNVENNANLVPGDTNIENNPAINIENNPENNNDVNVENNTNVENNPVNTVETGDNTITTGDTNIENNPTVENNTNVETGDVDNSSEATTGNVENNTNVETGDVNNSSEATTGNVENNTTVETGDVTNTNTAEGGNNSNDNTVEIKDNTLNNEANGGNSSNNNTNEGNTTTVETGDNTNGGNTNNNNNENNNENNNNTCTDCNDQQGGSADGGDSQSSDTPKTGEVVAHYVDIYGNMIGVDMPYEGQVGERYNTILRSFRGYRLTQVVGARSGQFEDGMIDVTYIYEKLPTGSTSGYDIPENDYYNYATNPSSSKYSRVTIPNTSVSSNNNLIVLLINLVMIISLGLYKKFAK